MDIDEFKKKHAKIEIEVIEDVDYAENEEGDEIEVDITYYILRNIPTLDGAELRLVDGEFARLSQILDSKPSMFKSVLGAKVGNSVQVVLTRVAGSRPFLRIGLFRTHSGSLKIGTSFRDLAISVVVHLGRHVGTDIEFIAERMLGLAQTARGQFIATIDGLPSTGTEESCKSVMRSILFDVEVTYGLSLELANLEAAKARVNTEREKSPALPNDEINMLIKNYVPELIEYYHTALKIDHQPFKFICYFHTLEYFMDKSAHRSISKRLKQILMKPDFHIGHSAYIADAIKIFRAETEKHMTDKVKINRVLSEYVVKSEVESFVKQGAFGDHFLKDHQLSNMKSAKIGALSFDSDISFFDSLAKRIYTLRCSIVHSNPDFDESKAVPFHPSPANLEFLRIENRLMREVSQMVIVNSTD